MDRKCLEYYGGGGVEDSGLRITLHVKIVSLLWIPFALLFNPYNNIAGGGTSINVPILQPENKD